MGVNKKHFSYFLRGDRFGDERFWSSLAIVKEGPCSLLTADVDSVVRFVLMGVALSLTPPSDVTPACA